MKKTTIEKITLKSVSSVLVIAEKQLGIGYINSEDLLSKENIALLASIDGEVVGFCTGKKITIQEIYESFPQLKENQLEKNNNNGNFGMVGSVATDPNYTGKGIASILVNSCINQLKVKGLDTILMTAWKSDKGVHISSIAKKYDFKPLLEIPNFWKEDSIINDYDCPSCGRPPCRCSAVIYLRKS
jgi:ribosomal protein S18 acetylase RimI-like enzyme